MKRIFTLAAVASISGASLATMQAGCSSDSDATTVDSGSPDVETERPKPRPEDDLDASTTCPRSQLITGEEIEQSIGPWKAPGPTQSVCEQSDVDAVAALFAKSESVEYAAIKRALSTKCSECVFSAKNGERWGMFVEYEDGIMENQTAACFARLTDDDDCGRKRWRWEVCLSSTCRDTECPNESALRACFPEAQNGACKEITADYVAACPNDRELFPSCDSIFKTLIITCGGGQDGGLEAGVPEAGAP